MKSILLVLAISFAFVAAQSPFVVSLIYTGDTECTDASKLIWVQVTAYSEGVNCTQAEFNVCEEYAPGNTQSWITKCYSTAAEIPVPQSASSVWRYSSMNCTGAPTKATITVNGIASCRPETAGDATMFDCTSACTDNLDSDGEGQCVAVKGSSTKYACDTNELPVEWFPAVPVAAPVDAPLAEPVANAPTTASAPTKAPSATPVKKSSDAHVAAACLAFVAVVLVL